MSVVRIGAIAIALACSSRVASAQFSYNSPTGTPLPGTVSAVGGIVVDLIGTNGNRIVAQRAASGLFVGDTPGTQFLTIGTQSGFTPAIVSQLGGGLTSAAFRITLFDGDSRSGNFDFNENWLVINGSRIQNFSVVSTIETSGSGTPVGGGGNIANGFGNNILNTGFFFTNNATALNNIFAALLGGSLTYLYEDADPGDQFLDFTQGLDASVIDVGQPPVVAPPSTSVPEPSTYALMATGLLALAMANRKRRN